MSVTKCSKCHRVLEGEHKFCPFCGNDLRQTEDAQVPGATSGGEGVPAGTMCPGCSQPLTGDHKFCPHCGEDLRSRKPAASAPAPPSRIVTKSENVPTRTVTVAAPKRGFRLVDLRVLIGWLGLIQLPVLLVLGALLFLPRLRPQPVSTACADIDRTLFAVPRFQSGLTGDLEEDTLFEADGEYLIQDTLVVPKNRQLLIEPGARLQFTSAGAIEVQGTLYVCGDEGNPITFTSEDQEPGAWNGIYFNNASDDSTIEHALFQFGGDRVLVLENTNPTLIDVEVANSTGFGVSSDGTGLPAVMQDVVLGENPFEGIEIRGGATIPEQEEVTWPDFGLPYVISGRFTVGENASLTIAPEVAVKFWQGPRSDAPELRVRGLLTAENVNFTSVYDPRDEVGGATYVEGRDPDAGDWAGLTFDESSNRSVLRQVTVSFAGQGSRAAILMINSSPMLEEVTVAESAWYPLSADASSEPSLKGITLVDNEPGDALEIRGGSSFAGREIFRWSRLGDDQQLVRVVRGTVTVNQEATLVVDEGVVVKFEPGSRLEVRGTLQVAGGDDGERRVVFTSLRDDEYGGRTDKNTGPQDDRAWDGIVFDGVDESSQIEDALIRFGSVFVRNGSPRLRNVTIAESGRAAIWLTVDAAPLLEQVTLRDNEVDGAAIAEGTLNEDQEWLLLNGEEEQIVRVLTGNVRIAAGATLRVGSGVVLKSEEDGQLEVNGDLEILGEGDRPVIITSIFDDTTAGDTSPALREPAPEDWRGILVGDQGRLRVGNATIRYAGTALRLRGPQPPSVSGILFLQDSIEALRCTVELTLPESVRTRGNEIDELECPTP